MLLPNYQEAKKRTHRDVEIDHYQFDPALSHLGDGKTYYVKTYGCQMNEHDSENIRAMLEQLGFQPLPDDDYENADLVLLNTCSIRENAHNKAFGMLGRLKHLKAKKKDLIVGLCGCMAQEEGVVQEIMKRYRFVNFVFGTHNLHRLPFILKDALDAHQQNIEVFSEEGNIIEDVPVKRDHPYKAYVNIIYGCDKFCTYCIVPYTRGKQRSRRPLDIIHEVEQLVADGYQEVTLLGQNVNAYGKDFDFEYRMENLLEDVAKTNIPRVRFMTSHPWDFTDGMIDVIAKYENIMPSIHLPVQSGSDRILKLMGRRYTKEKYLTLFHKMKERIPRLAVSTDIIVGFPGETEEDFEETMKLVETCQFDNAFTFIFSPREGTPAAKMKDEVTLAVKEERLHRLNERVNHYFLKNNQKMVGSIVPVLVDGYNQSGKTSLFGYTDTNKLINFDGDASLIGKIVMVKVSNAKTWSLDGEYESERVG